MATKGEYLYVVRPNGEIPLAMYLKFVNWRDVVKILVHEAPHSERDRQCCMKDPS